ncbi:MAG: N-formylglutamate amidohydrolase [Gammaproteobacteria bacterium]
MKALPLGLSVPHAGLTVPPDVAGLCVLTPEQVARDGDEGAAAVYFPLADDVLAFQTTEVARAIVDLNRATDDFRPDGVVKTHTCWNEPVYAALPDPATVASLLAAWHAPYHAALSAWAGRGDLLAAIDCHTMAEFGPPVGPDPDAERPLVCLGNVNGASCPAGWAERLADCLEQAFGEPVALNVPFSGGYVTRTHGREMPWIQLELSRTARVSNADKTAGIRAALERWCAGL